MSQPKKFPTLYDLAKALARWEGEGGSVDLPQESHSGQDIQTQRVEERIVRCLGAAVILQWNHLPTEIQRNLFEAAASMSDHEQQFRLKQEIARFLHDHKDDTL